ELQQTQGPREAPVTFAQAQAITALALAFERCDIRILNDPVLVSELVAYPTQSQQAKANRADCNSAVSACSPELDSLSRPSVTCVPAVGPAWISRFTRSSLEE